MLDQFLDDEGAQVLLEGALDESFLFALGGVVQGQGADEGNDGGEQGGKQGKPYPLAIGNYSGEDGERQKDDERNDVMPDMASEPHGD